MLPDREAGKTVRKQEETKWKQSGAASMGMMIIWMVIIFEIMYFLMIRPQKRAEKDLRLC